MNITNKTFTSLAFIFSLQTFSSEIHTVTKQTSTTIKLRPHSPEIQRRTLSKNELRLFQLAKKYPVLAVKAEIGKLITEDKVNINIQDDFGHTPLHKAVLYATGPMYTYLVALGAQEDIASYERELHYNVEKDCLHCTHLIKAKTPRELLESLPNATPEGEIRR